MGTALKAAVIGAAAGAAAVVLSDDKKRKKLQVGFKKAMKEGTEKFDELSGKTGDFAAQASELVSQKVEELEKRVSEGWKSANKPVK